MGLLKPWTIAEHSLFSIIPQTIIAQKRALQWWENEPREPKISSIAGTSRSNHSIDRWRTFRPGFRRTSIATSQHLTELLIWNAKDVSHFCSLDPLLQIAWGIKTNHVIGPVLPRTKSWTIYTRVRVSCKPYSYKSSSFRVLCCPQPEKAADYFLSYKRPN